MKKDKLIYSLITGASRGLGKAMVHELASNNRNIILVSLPHQDLSNLAVSVAKQYGVQCVFFETDLSINTDVIKLCDEINSSYNVDVLINNAGIGGSNYFTKANVNSINNILQLNIVATSLITKQLLPNLLLQPQSYILNVSSIAAYSPIAFKTVYPATKAFVYSFSRGLNEELKDTNISVSVVMPGAMKTNIEITKRIESQGWFAQLILLKTSEVAKKSIKQLFNKKKVIVLNKWSVLLMKILPNIFRIPMLSNTIKRELSTGV